MAKTVDWIGSTPTNCDVCGKPILDTFVDGKTRGGPWGMMCVPCHGAHGVGLGLGRGQRYRKSNDKWKKEAG